jgi:hypothetical protein
MTRHGPALLTLSIIASAGWAYNVNYDTRAVLDRLSALRSEIAQEREALQVLRVEWAYLNAPDRLAGLVAAQNDVLGLVPLVPDALGIVAAVPYPPRETPPDAAPLPPPAPEALIAAAPAAPVPAAPALATTIPDAAPAGPDPATIAVAMRMTDEPAAETVPEALEASIAAALVAVGVPVADQPRRGVPRSGVITIPAEAATGIFAAAAPGVPMPAARPAAWSPR